MFKSSRYIKQKQLAQQTECTICYESSPDIVRCKGPCHKYFCLKCVSRSKYKTGPCPNRCSDIFQIEQLGIHFTFSCPFESKGCDHTSGSEQQFEKHYKICEFITEECKKQLIQKNTYVCPKDHNLIFLTQEVCINIFGSDNYYSIIMNKKCSLCGDLTLCRSICMECSDQDKKVSFCIKCRQVPCTKTSCPIGHELIPRTQFTYSFTCDFCGLSALIFHNVAYEDLACNFDICSRCHNKLSEQHPLIPLPQVFQN